MATENPAPIDEIVRTLSDGLVRRGWGVREIETGPLSGRLIATDPATGEQCEVDVLKEAFWAPPALTEYGPVLALDEVYGGNPRLRAALEEHGIGYVLAVACSAEMATGAGRVRADALVKKVPKRAWQKLSAGRGAKGQRFYDWAVVDLVESMPGSHQLLIRRSRTTGELAYYRCHSTVPAPLTVLVETAGSRWRVEETFQAEKGLAGLGEHRVVRVLSDLLSCVRL